MKSILGMLMYPLFFILAPYMSWLPGRDDVDDCTITSTTESQVCIHSDGDKRIIESNDLPNHTTGKFPNSGNPNTISAQQLHFEVPLHPTVNKNITPLVDFNSRPPNNYQFGVALNGVKFDPGAAEFWVDTKTGRIDRTWQLEAIRAGLGMDQNNAHVQPTGAYHYHGVPTALVADEDGSKHSKLLGYAADGFPIYYKFVHEYPMDANSKIVAAHSGYQLKQGRRAANEPDGSYDGTYVQDYVYIDNPGKLDACNGRYGVTPEYPEGTYYYVLTDEFPYVPRCFAGTPDVSFKLGPPQGQNGRNGKMGPPSMGGRQMGPPPGGSNMGPPPNGQQPPR